MLVDAVCVVDKNGNFLNVSPSAKQIFGYTQAEMMGKQMLQLVRPSDRVRECDTTARFDDDEFVVLLENIERPE